MSISFEISDVTSLTNNKEISVRVVGINATGEEMPLASELSSKVKEFVLDYVNDASADSKHKKQTR